MGREYIKTSSCRTGCVLAKDVISSNGVKLAAENTIINEYIKERFLELGVDYIWVRETPKNTEQNKREALYESIKENYEEDVEAIRKVLINLASGKELDYENLKNISDSVYMKKNSIDLILRCLLELRNADEYTYNHSINVSIYSMLIAKWAGMPEEDIHNAIIAGMLHDIGKVKIPDEILNKKDRLSREEYEEIKKHTLYGYDIIKDNCSILKDVQDAILMHHERIDGSGYPLGKSGESFNKYARIVAIADVYDAMTSNRVYKKGVHPFAAFEMFITQGMSLFDTTLLKSFLNNLPAYYTGAKVVLENGETGEIVYIPPYDITSPIIHINSDYMDLSRDNSVKIRSVE